MVKSAFTSMPAGTEKIDCINTIEIVSHDPNQFLPAFVLV